MNGTTYSDELSFVEGSDDSMYPSWLFSSVLNDFDDDDYYNQSFLDDELSSKVKKLKRRYNDFFDWQEAMEVYNEYMQTLVDKYGSYSLVKNSVDAGTFPEYVPGKPKLKNTKKNRKILKYGFIPSQRIVNLPPDPERTFAIARRMFPDKMGDDVDAGNMNAKMSKKQKRAFERSQEKLNRRYRRENMYRVAGDSRGADFIVTYLNQAKRGIYNSSGYRTKEDDDNRSFADRYEEYLYYENTPAWQIEEDTTTNTALSNGRVINRREAERMEIYKILYREGFNVIGNLNDRMDRKSVKMIRNQIGATEPLTKKEMKKLKKRNKKDQKRIKRREDNNQVLTGMLLGNKLDHVVQRDDQGNLTMRLRDMFPDD